MLVHLKIFFVNVTTIVDYLLNLVWEILGQNNIVVGPYSMSVEKINTCLFKDTATITSLPYQWVVHVWQRHYVCVKCWIDATCPVWSSITNLPSRYFSNAGTLIVMKSPETITVIMSGIMKQWDIKKLFHYSLFYSFSWRGKNIRSMDIGQ